MLAQLTKTKTRTKTIQHIDDASPEVAELRARLAAIDTRLADRRAELDEAKAEYRGPMPDINALADMLLESDDLSLPDLEGEKINRARHIRRLGVEVKALEEAKQRVALDLQNATGRASRKVIADILPQYKQLEAEAWGAARALHEANARCRQFLDDLNAAGYVAEAVFAERGEPWGGPLSRDVREWLKRSITRAR